MGGVHVPPPRGDRVKRLGKPVALSTIYRMLARNGWRKLAPDTAHPQRCCGPRGLEKKLPGKLGEIVASWRNGRPLRLMFQDEARFGRIADTCSCGCRRRRGHSSKPW